jgi:hypothetical protein
MNFKRDREREKKYWVLEDRLGVVLSRSEMGFWFVWIF